MKHWRFGLPLVLLVFTGCDQHPLTDYRPLDAAGMWSGAIVQLKALHPSDAEVAQVVKLKQANTSDETCIALVTAAHNTKHTLYNADSVISLAGAGYTDAQILEIAQAGKLDVLSGDAVMLRLVGLSDSAVQSVLHRRLQGTPTMSSGQIARLKNTGLTEKQILERIDNGMTDAEADKEVAAREASRNHANTDFVRNRGRKPH